MCLRVVDLSRSAIKETILLKQVVSLAAVLLY